MLTSVRQALGETWGFRSAESIRKVRRQAKILFATTRNAYKNRALYQEVGGEDAEHPCQRANQVVDDGAGMRRVRISGAARCQSKPSAVETPTSDRSMVWRFEATGGAIASPHTGTAQPVR